MLALCGILKVNEFRMQTFGVHVVKFEENVDLTEKLSQYLEGLNPYTKAMIENDVKAYVKSGPIDAIEIVVDSGESRYVTINKVIYERLSRYIQAERRVVRIKFKFYNRMQRCTYTDTEASGDYLLIPVACKTDNEEVAAVAWCRETIKSILQGMYEKYGNNLSATEALEMLGIDPLTAESEEEKEPEEVTMKPPRKFEVVKEVEKANKNKEEEKEEMNTEVNREVGIVAGNEQVQAPSSGTAAIDAYLKDVEVAQKKMDAFLSGEAAQQTDVVPANQATAEAQAQQAPIVDAVVEKSEPLPFQAEEAHIAEGFLEEQETQEIQEVQESAPSAVVVEQETVLANAAVDAQEEINQEEVTDAIAQVKEEELQPREGNVTQPKPIGFGFDDDNDDMANAMAGM